MSIVKKNALWFTLYGIFITGVFLYLLFPSDIVKSRLEEALNSSDLILKTKSLNPSLPFGVKFKDITISSTLSGDNPFQGESLDVQFNPISLFQKNKSIGLSGKAYSGKFKGYLRFPSFSKVYPPKEWDLNLQNIDLGKYTYIKNLLGKEITGKVNGSLNYSSLDKSGIIGLVLNKGSYPLSEPFLGMNRVDFDAVEIKAKLQSGVLKLEMLEISGPQIKCLLKGEITLDDFFQNSRLNLSGEMELRGQSKTKMKVSIGGTLANPELRYI
jgi:type II secretion system protein N